MTYESFDFGKVDVPAWMDEAICATIDYDLWFPHEGCRPNTALSICQGCPVKRPCLEYALEFESRWDVRGYGVFGGKTAAERRTILRKQREEGAA